MSSNIFPILTQKDFLVRTAKFYGLLLACLCWGFSPAQNLVPNGSFEEGDTCQLSYTKSAMPAPWAAVGTPDVYKTGCEIISPTVNLTGVCAPYHGSTFVGLSMDLPQMHRHKWVEQLRVKFGQPLQKDSLYEVSFYISLASTSTSALKQVSVRIASQMYAHYTPPEEIFELDVNEPFAPGEWIRVSTNIKAAGGERWLVIGNYLGMDNFVRLKRPKGDNVRCYMYVDSVNLIALNPPALVTQNDTVTISGVNFATNQSMLEPSAYPILDEVLNSLPQNRTYSVLIIGHTDSIGSFDDNIVLSTNRALAVKEYLIGKGIEPAMITTKGMGPLAPVATNETEAGRSLNRRVEVIIGR